MQGITPISRIMSRKPVTVAPLDNLETVHDIFATHGFHHIPVVEGDQLVGLVSYTDYLQVIRNTFGNAQEQRMNEKLLHALLAKDVMTEHLVCLAPFDTIEDALRVFRTNHFHAVPVVESDRRLVGILTTHDLIRTMEKMLVLEHYHPV